MAWSAGRCSDFGGLGSVRHVDARHQDLEDGDRVSRANDVAVGEQAPLDRPAVDRGAVARPAIGDLPSAVGELPERSVATRQPGVSDRSTGAVFAIEPGTADEQHGAGRRVR